MAPMKRWGLSFLAVLASSIFVFCQRWSSASLLTDSDTVAILGGIRARHNPLAWFTGDWPLGNHFYRPISTLFFEFDNAVYGNHPAGYGATNAFLCAACILALFWFLRELTERPALTTAATLLFAAWHTAEFPYYLPALTWLIAPVLLLGFFRHGFRLDRFLPGALIVFFLVVELVARPDRGTFLVDVERWLPGRTATSMTLFALLAMAAFVRAIRVSRGPLAPRAPGPLDPPATKSTTSTAAQAANPLPWLLASLVLSAIAYGCYEQAVMLPAAIAVAALTMKLRGYHFKASWLAPCWGLLVAYLLLRWSVVPHAVSGYQAQQFRTGPGVVLALLRYTCPTAQSLWLVAQTLDVGIGIFSEPGPWIAIFSFVGTLIGLVAVRRYAILAYSSLVLSVVAFLPMAWVKPFAHYDYWPLALRSLFVVMLFLTTWRLIVSALSPRERRAPVRLAPAPGSLPHL